jgi:hypothetical protein
MVSSGRHRRIADLHLTLLAGAVERMAAGAKGIIAENAPKFGQFQAFARSADQMSVNGLVRL